MEKRHNYAAAGFLLLGIGAAGRAFLGVPEGVTMAELSLTVLLVIGALLLTRQGLGCACVRVGGHGTGACFVRFLGAGRRGFGRCCAVFAAG